MSEQIRVHVLRKPGRKNLYMRYVDPLTGKQVTRSTEKTKQRDAERAAAKWEAELQAGRYKSPLKVTWEEFRHRYESEALSGLSDRTANRCLIVFGGIEEFSTVQYLAQLTADRISTWQQKLRDKGLSENTIKSYTAHLKASLRWAKDIGLLLEVPKIRMPARAKGSKVMKGRAITTEEFERMLAKTADVVGERFAAHWQHLLHGLWWSGLRIGEALQLTWDGDGMAIEVADGEVFLAIAADSQKSNENEVCHFYENLLPVK